MNHLKIQRKKCKCHRSQDKAEPAQTPFRQMYFPSYEKDKKYSESCHTAQKQQIRRQRQTVQQSSPEKHKADS